MTRVLLAVALGSIAASMLGGCGLDSQGNLDSSDGGKKKGDGGNDIGGGQCFPGAKVCPNSKGDLICLDANTPETGCKSTTACSACVVPHAKASCTGTGKCAVGECDTGWADCDGDPVDGCETNIQGDPKHCGDCSIDCIGTRGPGWICKSGQCEVNQCCPTGASECLYRQDCDGDKSNGCEVDTATDANNCLFCGNVCALPNATSVCTATACTVQTCNPGFANCDQIDANGCETNIASDAGNCGGCGTVCNSTNGIPGCNNGQCGILCTSGFGDCDSSAANGCETDLGTSASHCGVCGNGCAPQNATAACSSGSCSYSACASGFGDCDGNVANGCETNLLSNVSHCSACNYACSAPANGTPSCTGGACTFTCGAGYSDCASGTTCFNTLTDPGHCGTGCTPCPTPVGGTAACDNGACGVNCTPPYGECANQCYDFQNDKLHCGGCTGCTDPPNGVRNCVGGGCVLTCNPYFTKCNGFCVDTNSSNNHCGGCNMPCVAGKTCQSGSCKCGGATPNDCSGVCAQCCDDTHCSGKKCCLGLCQAVVSCT